MFSAGCRKGCAAECDPLEIRIVGKEKREATWTSRSLNDLKNQAFAVSAFAGSGFFQVRFGALVTSPRLSARVETRM